MFLTKKNLDNAYQKHIHKQETLSLALLMSKCKTCIIIFTKYCIITQSVDSLIPKLKIKVNTKINALFFNIIPTNKDTKISTYTIFLFTSIESSIRIDRIKPTTKAVVCIK